MKWANSLKLNVFTIVFIIDITHSSSVILYNWEYYRGVFETSRTFTMELVAKKVQKCTHVKAVN